MIQRISAVVLVSFIAACSSQGGDPDEQAGQLYSYVDAQGNLVTVERPPETGDSAGDDTASAEAGEGDAEDDYQTPEEVEQKLEKRQRDRFVSYMGPDGEVISRPLDLVAEREAQSGKPAPYEEVDPGEQYMETLSRVPADCCAHALEQALPVEPGDERRVAFGPGKGNWIRLDHPRPAVVLELSAALGKLVLRSFVHDKAYLSPRLLLLDDKGMPVLKVDNLFIRRYPENWYRFGYFEGELPLGPEHAYVVLYLPYGLWDQGMVEADGSVMGVVEDGARPALEGELVVRGHRGSRKTSP